LLTRGSLDGPTPRGGGSDGRDAQVALALYSGTVWARMVGVIMASVAMVAAFAWLPWYPLWAVLLIAVSLGVVWALTAHGRDITTL
jgi:hypothetical protein